MTPFRATYVPLLNYSEWLSIKNFFRMKLPAGEVKPLLLFTSHPPVITVGKRGKREHLLLDNEDCRRIPVFYVDRGGDVTLHDEGQINFYPLIKYEYGKRVERFVKKLELTVCYLLESYGIGVRLEEKFPGVWTDKGKIAAVGMSLKGGVVTDGVALYVNTNKELFKCIVPCGLKRGIASMRDFLKSVPDREEIVQRWTGILSSVFGVTIEYLPFYEIKELKNGLEI